MKGTLRGNPQLEITSDFDVLILVLMEDTLRDIDIYGISKRKNVLILVLMEDTLRAIRLVKRKGEA